jgi:hypothetical protein
MEAAACSVASVTSAKSLVDFGNGSIRNGTAVIHTTWQKQGKLLPSHLKGKSSNQRGSRNRRYEGHFSKCRNGISSRSDRPRYGSVSRFRATVRLLCFCLECIRKLPLGILSADWRVDPRHETGSKGVSSGSIHTSQNLVSQESVDHPEAYRERFFAT